MTNQLKPELISISVDHIDRGLVSQVAGALLEGKLVAFPTETVYGLGCDAFNEAAIGRVFAVKGRPATDPLIVHVAGSEMLDRVVDGQLPPVARLLADHFWPGPLTLVLPRNSALPAAVTSGLPSVAVRSPSHPVASAILRECGIPIAAPSANRFGRISPTSAEHVLADLGDGCDVVVDSGRTQRGLESTVVSVDEDGVVVLRHGAIPMEELREHCSVRAVEDEGSKHLKASPGHEARHYSPRSPAVAVSPGAFASGSGALELTAKLRVLYAGYSDRPPQIPDSWQFEPLGSAGAIDELARNLYESLRRIDAIGADVIVLELAGEAGLGRAIDDRLTRAASSVVVERPEDLQAALTQALADDSFP